MRIARVFGYAFSLGLFACSLLLFFYRQDVIDWWRLIGYEPSPAIARLATDSSFSDKGRRLFYVHYPELLEKADFQGKCTTTEKTIVLGCYITHSKIFVLDVKDERIEGVVEVTAAHEMLHAVYDRLSSSEKSRIDNLLLAFFEKTEDARLKKTIEGYRERDPSVVPNELHSIIGTEFRNIPSELEEHYLKYFLDRASVVAVAEAYESEFTKLEDQAQQYLAEFEKLKKQINEFDNQLLMKNSDLQQERSNLGLLEAALEGEKSRLESLEDSPNAYNAALPAYNSIVSQYNAQINVVRTLIDEYNLLVNDRNALIDRQEELIDSLNELSVEEEGLIEAIDTRLPEAE